MTSAPPIVERLQSIGAIAFVSALAVSLPASRHFASCRFDQYSDVATALAADAVQQKVNGPQTSRAGNVVLSDIGSEMVEPSDVRASLVDLAFAESETIVDPIRPWELLTQPSRDVLEAAQAAAIVEVRTLFSRAL